MQIADFKQRLGRAKKQVMGLKRQVAEAQQQRDTALEQIQQAAAHEQPESAAGHLPNAAAEQLLDAQHAAALQQHADAEAVLSQQVHLGNASSS